MSAEGPSKPTNWEAIEAISGYDNDTVRQMLEASGVIKPETVLTGDSFDEIRAAAMDLAAGARETKSADDLLKNGYMVYARETRRIGDEAIKNLSDADLRASIHNTTGKTLSDDEIASLRMSILAPEDWIREREGAKAGETIRSFDVAIDDTGNVVATGATRDEAMRRAQQESGK
jgi:hypothetical protein